MYPTFHNAVAYYMSIWQADDQELLKKLLITQTGVAQAAEPEFRQTLILAARQYSVIRGFKREYEQTQFQHAATCLLQITERPSDQAAAIVCVGNLVQSLEKVYKRRLCSAASKFLWFRFQHPIVIFDSKAWGGLKRLGFSPSKDQTYEEYVQYWEKLYLDSSPKIEEACNEFLSFKRFTGVSHMDDSELLALIGNEWFRRRAFDAYLMLVDGAGKNFVP